MERQANYALVGAISTLLLIAGVVFVVWLGGSRFSNEYDRYRIIFEGPVRGLSVGGMSSSTVSRWVRSNGSGSTKTIPTG